jgi:hypothetical protein
MRRLAAAAVSLLLVACMPGMDPISEPAGPTLVIHVRNASDRELHVGYEFTAGAISGAGETLVAPCSRQPISAGKIGGGTYTIQVGGKTVVEATMPAGVPDDASVVVSVVVGPDGEVEALPAGLVEVPDVDIAPIPGCG